MYVSATTNLMVESVGESVAFYRDILGFLVVTSVCPAGSGELQFAIVAKDNVTLMFQERSNLSGEYPVLATDKVHPSVTLYIKADNFDALYIELKDKCTVLNEVHTTFYGAKEFAIKDNSGYVLTFTENA
ncbi:hypothetical protein FACS189499_00180 [Clostridia bacterium]|nr:hypothetical protein FACS189499_00180 [Clostridia bacterium]